MMDNQYYVESFIETPRDDNQSIKFQKGFKPDIVREMMDNQYQVLTTTRSIGLGLMFSFGPYMYF